VTTFRRLRRGAAFLALVSVLFAQFAIASYACPGSAAMATTAVSPMADMPGCEESAPEAERTALCQAHCQQGDQSSERAGVSAAPPAMQYAPPSMVFLVPAEATAPPEAAPQASLLERPTGPPLAVRHCCLRI
jgi:hypothetical protein